MRKSFEIKWKFSFRAHWIHNHHSATVANDHYYDESTQVSSSFAHLIHFKKPYFRVCVFISVSDRLANKFIKTFAWGCLRNSNTKSRASCRKSCWTSRCTTSSSNPGMSSTSRWSTSRAWTRHGGRQTPSHIRTMNLCSQTKRHQVMVNKEITIYVIFWSINDFSVDQMSKISDKWIQNYYITSFFEASMTFLSIKCQRIVTNDVKMFEKRNCNENTEIRIWNRCKQLSCMILDQLW